MADVIERKPLSIAAFRAWGKTRPHEEHWELIDGRPVIRAASTKAHQRIASNLERLLNDALMRSAPSEPPISGWD